MLFESYRFPARLGGNVCLDFTNTVEFRDSERCIEFLHSYDHVLAWCWRSNLIDDSQAARLHDQAARQPHEAAAAFQDALALRDSLYRIFVGITNSAPPVHADLARLNVVLDRTQRHVEFGSNGFVWSWAQSDDLGSILAPIALAAAEFLTSDQPARMRQCPNCGWLFVDTSRNHSRRWCSMEICGSQVKSRRQYERRKTARSHA